MARILGTIASSFAEANTSFESIATQIVTSSTASSVTFSNIPNTYDHLQIRVSARNNRTGNNQATLFYYINNDTNINNYTGHDLRTSGGGTVTATGYATGNYQALAGLYPSADLPSNLGVGIYDFLDYKNTNKHKTIRFLNGWDGNGSGWINLGSNLWLSTSAITTIKFDFPEWLIAQNSHFALYGIKGAA